MLFQFYVNHLVPDCDIEQVSGFLYAPNEKAAAACVMEKLRGRYEFSDKSRVIIRPIPEKRGRCHLIHRWDAGPRDKSAAFHMDDLISHW